MNKVVLANMDYRTHTTDEGNQLQEGLRSAGWMLSGEGYDGLRDVEWIVKKYDPKVIFIQDKRDWDPTRTGCFNKNIAFRNMHKLAEMKDIYKVCVVKDAGTCTEYQREAVEEVGADAITHYYSVKSVLDKSPWVSKYRMIRTYHSIDAEQIRKAQNAHIDRDHRDMVVSGAVNPLVYPMRLNVALLAAQNRYNAAARIRVLEHPGYGNVGCDQSRYYRELLRHRIHVATASAYNFALRKIIETCALGMGCITNLTDDPLPVIEPYIYHIPNRHGYDDGAGLLTELEKGCAWHLGGNYDRGEMSQKTLEFYDYRAAGARLDKAIMEAINGL